MNENEERNKEIPNEKTAGGDEHVREAIHETKEQPHKTKLALKIVGGVAVLCFIFVAGFITSNLLQSKESNGDYRKPIAERNWDYRDDKGHDYMDDIEDYIDSQVDEIDKETKITSEEAQKRALDANKDAKVKNVSFIRNNDSAFYIVSIEKADGKKQNVFVDAETGEIIPNSKS